MQFNNPLDLIIAVIFALAILAGAYVVMLVVSGNFWGRTVRTLKTASKTLGCLAMAIDGAVVDYRRLWKDIPVEVDCDAPRPKDGETTRVVEI